MNSTLRKFAQAGFTLVELLIVVIILAILAAIVIPQFSSSTTDAQESALDANLSALRSAIELYKVQHTSGYPGAVATTGGTCSVTKGTGGINSAQAWMDHLLMASDADGNTCSGAMTATDTTTFKYGPYVRKGIPADPITQKGALVGEIVSVATPTGAALVADTGNPGGWKVDTKSGQIIMNSGLPDSKTKAYSTH